LQALLQDPKGVDPMIHLLSLSSALGSLVR